MFCFSFLFAKKLSKIAYKGTKSPNPNNNRPTFELKSSIILYFQVKCRKKKKSQFPNYFKFSNDMCG